MVLKDNTEDLDLSFSFKIDGFNYMVFASSETMKCFGWGLEAHLIQSCQQRRGEQRLSTCFDGEVSNKQGQNVSNRLT